MNKVLALRPKTTPDRGEMLNASQVAEVVFNAHVTAQWVRRNVPGRLKFGQQCMKPLWYEQDVRDWIASTQEGT